MAFAGVCEGSSPSLPDSAMRRISISSLNRAAVRKVESMEPAQLAKLKAFALVLMLPGLAGLIVSAMISVHYLDTMPRWPSPRELRMAPRNIHGVVVYQTDKEDRNLDLIEYSSVGVFLAGLGLGLTYLEKWGARQMRETEDQEDMTEDFG
jgi:hypothetical protein